MSQKTVVAISELDFGSTGNITFDILNFLEEKGYKTYFACHELTKKRDNEFQISIGRLNYLFNKILCRFNASDGFHSKLSTRRLIKFLIKKKPNLLLLGNLHGSYLNLPILFKYIRDNNIKCVYTLHDCWSFTGKCAYFNDCDCYKWQTGCYKCPNLLSHPRGYIFDSTRLIYKKKKTLFDGMEKYITLVCPSKWLLNFIDMSYLKKFDVKLINNGINLNSSTEQVDYDNLFETNKINVLSVGMPLEERKGLSFINKLADELDSNKFNFITVGVPSNLKTSKNIKRVGHIDGKYKMNFFYKNADWFLNPSVADNFPTTNLESLMNGTPIISFLKTGAAEVVNNQVGLLVKYKDYAELKKIVSELTKKTDKISSACINESKKYTTSSMCKKYYELIEEIIK